MNTKLELSYKDASGWGHSTSFVVNGEITPEEIRRMRNIMLTTDSEGCFVIAHELGLPTPAELMAEEGETDFPTSDDHVFTAIDQFKDADPEPKDFLTDEEPTVDYFSTVLLVARMEKAPWDVVAEMKRLDMMP
jgi:hypothetical protein